MSAFSTQTCHYIRVTRRRVTRRSRADDAVVFLSDDRHSRRRPQAVRARGDERIGEVRRLLRGAALAVDRRGSNAEREARRGTSDPTYLVYTLGKWLILDLRQAYQQAVGADFRLGTFHDEFLTYGRAPISLIRQAMLEGSK